MRRRKKKTEALSLGHKALTADLEIRGKSSGDPCREGQINNRVTEAGNNDVTILPSLFWINYV